MSEYTSESGLRHNEGLTERVIQQVAVDLETLNKSRKAHVWHGEYPLEDTSVPAIFTAARNLMSSYRPNAGDHDYPCSFYLENGNDSIGVRFKPDSDDTIIQIVRNGRGISEFLPVLELAQTTGNDGTLTVFDKIDYSQTDYETVSTNQSTEAVGIVADVVAAARWDHVFGHTGIREGEDSASAMIEARFEQRERSITDAQASLDADRAMYAALRQYYGSDLAETLTMQGRIVTDSVVAASVSENGMVADKHNVLAQLLNEFAQNVGAIALSDSEVSIALRVVSDLKRPTVIDVQKDPSLQRWAEKYHHVYNGVSGAELAD